MVFSVVFYDCNKFICIHVILMKFYLETTNYFN